MRKSITLSEAPEWISQEQDFYVRRSRQAQELLPIAYSMRGAKVAAGQMSVMSRAIPRGQMPERAYVDMLHQMSRHGVVYVVYSYETPIGWKDSAGDWHLLPYRYSLTTTSHQNILFNVVGHGTHTERVELSAAVRVGRERW